MRVFLSYRRDDTAGRAGRLHDALVSRLGPRNVFMDVAAIAVGTDFVDQVDRAIAGSDVSLVVIGPNWLGARDADGQRRLDDPDDHVRSEVRSRSPPATRWCRCWSAVRLSHPKRSCPPTW